MRSSPAALAPALRALEPGGSRPWARARPGRARARTALAPATLVGVLLGAWELYVRLGSVSPLILPPPSAIAGSLLDDRGLLWSNFTVTAGEALGGIGLAPVGAVGLAGAIHFSRGLRLAVYPLLIASQAIPLVLVAPLIGAWLGFGLRAETRDRRPRVVLPDPRRHARRARRDRPGPAQAGADARRQPLAGVRPRRGAERPARGCSPAPASPSSSR